MWDCREGTNAPAAPVFQVPHGWTGWGMNPLAQWPYLMMQGLKMGQQLVHRQAALVQNPNTGVLAAIPFAGISPISGQPFGWSLYGQLPPLTPLPIPPGVDYFTKRPRMIYGDVALPLGGHLALAVKEKIWRGEFVDFFSLLHKKPELIVKVGDPAPTPRLLRNITLIKIGRIGSRVLSFIWLWLFSSSWPRRPRYLNTWI